MTKRVATMAELTRIPVAAAAATGRKLVISHQIETQQDHVENFLVMTENYQSPNKLSIP
jgi:hypothetical protein